ncbi:DUF262 domain-containing protein [Helicobacter sp. 12S02634-8]|uniref:GmrSD restriction endonuclease domain-containing protein n=1 Tax=Helicobacter sp. 12S02634-8 TaxID=1476199 RepID=UPI000BA61C58|nr:DUF262 domain-containing protein [Helicobacter sp. 12S02634-8]
MKGEAIKMTELMGRDDDYFIIPIYQRKYSWKKENCRQLYKDLKNLAQVSAGGGAK